MASAEDIYRESQARLHRILGAYLSLEAWKNGVDCVVLERKTLLSFLSLERMKNKRIDWLKSDLETLFPYASTTYYSKTKAYASLYISRKKMPRNNAIWKPMSTKERVALFKREELAAKIINLPEEKILLSRMALICNGVEEL